jgi:hypothetical protein
VTKYRIVKRGKRFFNVQKYYAQKKLFNLFWVDLNPHSVSGFDRWQSGGETPSYCQELVENYIEMLKENCFTTKQSVVKTYD